jgi:YbbR domain-containing protein
MESGAAMSVRSIWRALTRNLGWKLGSLVLSVSLWFAIVGEPELVATHSVPILYRNLPPDLLIGSDAVDSVRVELRGPSSKLTAGNLSDVAVLLDLSSIGGPGERTYTLSDGDLHLPEGVTFLRAIPSQLRLQFSHLRRKDVPVQIRFAQPPPNGYTITSQTVEPSQLRIAGPELRVERTTSAQTDAIDLSSVTQSSEFHVNTFISDPQVRLENSSVVTVKVTVEKIGNTP